MQAESGKLPSRQSNAVVQVISRDEEKALSDATPADSEATGGSVWVRRLKLMGGLMLPVFTETLDYTVVATAQPHIASTLHHLELQSWIGTVYVLTSTVFLPLWGSISNVFGRHKSLQAGLFLFLVGSAICTGANGMPVLLIGRGLSGVGAAGLLAVSRIILYESSQIDDSVYQSTMFAALHGIGYGFGPVLGGLLTQANWRWIFAINIPIAILSSILAFVLVRRIVPGPRLPKSPTPSLPSDFSQNMPRHPLIEKLARVDWIGATIFILGGISTLLGLHWASVTPNGWGSARVIVSLVAGGALIGCFLLWEHLVNSFEKGVRAPPALLRHLEPMIPLDIFKSYDVPACCFTSLTLGAAIFGVLYELAIFFAISKGDSATKSGAQLLYFLPGLGGGLIASMLLIKSLRQPKYSILAGTCILSLGLGLLARALGRDDNTEIRGFLSMVGVGLGLTMSATAIQSRFSQPPDRIASVVSVTTFFYIGGGTIGLAQLSAVLNSQIQSYITSCIRDGTLTPTEAGLLGSSSAALDSIQGIESLAPGLQRVVQEAYRQGVMWAFISLVPWAAISFVISFGLKRVESGPEDEDVAKP